MYQIDRDTLQIYNQHSSKEIQIRYIQEDFDSEFYSRTGSVTEVTTISQLHHQNSTPQECINHLISMAEAQAVCLEEEEARTAERLECLTVQNM